MDLMDPKCALWTWDMSALGRICGHGRCEILYMDVTQNLHKIVIGLCLLAAMGIWVANKTCRDRRAEQMMDYYSLPTAKKIK